MSHVVTVKLPAEAGELDDLDAIRAAFEAMGGEFLAGQTTYAWYGQHVGDYPLPAGFTAADMGHCDHAVRFPGIDYEVGIVARDGRFNVIYDFFQGSLSEKMGGPEATHFVAAYQGIVRQKRAVAALQEVARQRRLPATLQRLPSGVVKLTVRLPG